MPPFFAVNQLVTVLDRPWLNKEGGDARVVEVNANGTLAVAYIIGNRREHSVDVQVGSMARPCESID